MKSSIKNLYMNIYGDTLRKIMEDLFFQIKDEVDYKSYNDGKYEFENHVFKITSLRDAIKIYKEHNSVDNREVNGYETYINENMKHYQKYLREDKLNRILK